MNSVITRNQLIFIFLILILPIAIIQAYWLQGPLERDQSIYFIIAHQILQGRQLYSDLWDHKPPAIHMAYVLAEMVAGYSIRALWLLGVLLGTSSGVGLYLLLRRYTVNATGIGLALFLWIALCISPNLEATQPNTEAFICCCWIWSGVLLLTGKPVLWRHVLAGILCGIATLFKPIAIILFIPPALISVFGAEKKWREIMLLVGAFLLIPVMLWGCCYGYYLFHGRGSDFYQAVFIYNRAYAGSLASNLKGLFSFRHLFPPALLALYLPLTMIVIVAARFLCQSGRRCLAAGIFAGLFLVYITIALPGNFYLHYYQYMLPLVALAAGILISKAMPVTARVLTIAVVVIGLLAELPTVFFPQYFHRAPKFSQSLNMQARNIAPVLRQHLKPGEWFYEWGAQPGLYFESGVEPRHGALHASWLLDGPVAQRMSEETLRTLRRDPPALVVLSAAFVTEPGRGHPVLKWIAENYQSDERFQQHGPFTVLRQKGT